MKRRGLALGLALLGSALAANAEVRLLNFSEYMDPQILKDFERQSGMRVRTDYYEAPEDLLAKLQAGGVRQYDVVVASDAVMPSLIALKLLQPLGAGVPNLKNLDPRFRNPPFDPRNRYSAAYQWGYVGLLYRKGAYPSPPTSWQALLGPKPAGKFVLMDSPREQLAVALRAAGRPVNSQARADLQAAGQVLLGARKSPKFLGFQGGVAALNQVRSGQADAAVVYSGESARAAGEDPRLALTIPREGSTLFLDSLAVPAGAPNPAGARALINYILEAKVGAQLSNYTRYPTPNAAARPLIRAADRRNPAIYPPAADRARLSYLTPLGDAAKLYDEVWTLVRSR